MQKVSTLLPLVGVAFTVAAAAIIVGLFNAEPHRAALDKPAALSDESLPMLETSTGILNIASAWVLPPAPDVVFSGDYYKRVTFRDPICIRYRDGPWVAFGGVINCSPLEKANPMPPPPYLVPGVGAKNVTVSP